MTDTEYDGRIEHRVRELLGEDWQTRIGPVWLTCVPEGAPPLGEGWKLHISSRAATFTELVDVVIPVLRDARCLFKLALSSDVLERLNDGATAPATVGKAFTIYPDPGLVVDLGHRLADLLRGRQGPRVLSDRIVRPDAPVYYRYGPFGGAWRSGARGQLVTDLSGPEGEKFDGIATMRYRQPTWAVDPFTGESGVQDDPATARPIVLGGHYRILEGLVESARGNVYRAVDERDGSRVVVKQARAFVFEHAGDDDVRLRLRNERRVLQALDDADGVPRFFDHFRYGQDEFLVSTDVGPVSLEQDVLTNGTYSMPGTGNAAGARTLESLAHDLARIVTDLHERGVYMRDIAPKNIVLDDTTERVKVTFVDFGIAWYDGVFVRGGTPGYAPRRQRGGEEPRDTDDLHALGMTLLFAALGTGPTVLGESADRPRRGALQAIRSVYGDAPAGLVGTIADLLGEDADTARRALRRLAEGTGREAPATRTRLPELPRCGVDISAEITVHLVENLLHQTRALLAATDEHQLRNEASIYGGSAGIGLELLAHAERPGVPDTLRRLVTFTGRAQARVGLPPGLFTGATGAALFLHAARQQGFDPDGAADAARMPDEDWTPEGDDLIIGAAGVGLGHLLLRRFEGDPAHLDIARRCVDYLVRGQGTSAFPSGEMPAAASVDIGAGRAHGVAGAAELLLAYAEQTGDDDVRVVAARRVEDMVRRISPLIGAVAERRAGVVPIAASWCQGLAGTGITLLHAADVLDDPALARLAGRVGDACAAFTPRLMALGQCCGASGVGNLLIDLAEYEQDERRWTQAEAVAAHMLSRAAGTPTRPVFLDEAPEAGSASWSAGVAGILTFFRRLSARGGESLPLHLARSAGADTMSPAVAG